MGKAELEALRRQEEKEVSGLQVRTPRARLLDASEVQKKHPDLHLRFVNIKDPEKAEARKEEGYRRLTSEEGGKQIGDQLALFGIPKKQAQAKAHEYRRQDRLKLDAHRKAMQSAAEAGVRDLRDKAGLRMNVQDVLVDESTNTGE